MRSVAEEPASQYWPCQVEGAPSLDFSAGPRRESPPHLEGLETFPTTTLSVNECLLSACCVQGSSSQAAEVALVEGPGGAASAAVSPRGHILSFLQVGASLPVEFPF